MELQLAEEELRVLARISSLSLSLYLFCELTTLFVMTVHVGTGKRSMRWRKLRRPQTRVKPLSLAICDHPLEGLPPFPLSDLDILPSELKAVKNQQHDAMHKLGCLTSIHVQNDVFFISIQVTPPSVRPSQDVVFFLCRLLGSQRRCVFCGQDHIGTINGLRLGFLPSTRVRSQVTQAPGCSTLSVITASAFPVVIVGKACSHI